MGCSHALAVGDTRCLEQPRGQPPEMERTHAHGDWLGEHGGVESRRLSRHPPSPHLGEGEGEGEGEGVGEGEGEGEGEGVGEGAGEGVGEVRGRGLGRGRG